MNFLNSSIDSKLGFWVLVLRCVFKFFPIQKEILGYLNVALAGILNFSQFLKNMEAGDFGYKPKLYLQVFLNSLKSWEIFYCGVYIPLL